MQLTFISDTHGLHQQLELPGGDVLVHAGDVSLKGTEREIIAFLEWFKVQPYTYKLFIAGNHDWFFEDKSAADIEKIIPKEVVYLNDSGVEIRGVKFWGSPVQPTFFNWAFNRERGKDIDKHWQLIPKDVQVLITHGPPMGILDQTARGMAVGCENLTHWVMENPPKIHVFGHIHEAYGILETENTVFINASVLNLKYRCVNLPINWLLEG